QRNIAQLRADGCEIIEPTQGWQACRTEGIGRLAEPDAILDAVMSKLSALTRASGHTSNAATTGRGLLLDRRDCSRSSLRPA
ncbi:MAG: hypothetical protein O7D91_12505, partial [Planctomycetota bacterium]|nr:hypothetical protein [Planctomycetota bacterium]